MVANGATVVAAVRFEVNALGGCTLVDLACVFLVTDGLGGMGIDFDDSDVVCAVAGVTALLAVVVRLCCATVGTRSEEVFGVAALVTGKVLLAAEAFARVNA